MKNNLLLGILLFAGIFMTAGCKKETVVENITNPTDKSFTAKIDGVLWEASPLFINAEYNGTNYIIAAYDAATENTMSFELTSFDKGTYAIDSVNTVLLTHGSDIYYGVGTLTITSNNGSKIDGTYSYTGTEMMGSGGTVEVTEGKFKNVTIL